MLHAGHFSIPPLAQSLHLMMPAILPQFEHLLCPKKSLSLSCRKVSSKNADLNLIHLASRCAFVVFLFRLGLMVGWSVGGTSSSWISVSGVVMDWGTDDEKVVGSGVVDWLCVEESNLFWDHKVPRCSSSWLTVTKSDVFNDGKVLGRGRARQNPVGFWGRLAGRTSFDGFDCFNMEVYWRKKDSSEWYGYKGRMT